MPRQEMLTMAVTYMRTGVCIAGFLRARDERSALRWIRPVREHGTLLLGDITTADGRVVAVGDVVSLHLQHPCPDPPHCEDWRVDWIHHRPEIVQHLPPDRWARLLEGYCDRAPEDILVHSTRSLCLIQPDRIWTSFQRDGGSGQYGARLGFELTGVPHPRANSPQGLPVTDLKWRALGRRWLGSVPTLSLSGDEIVERLGVEAIYLALGLSRGFEGRTWLLVIGVHTVPDYSVAIDYANL